MDVTEMQIVSWTIGRLTHHKRIQKMCSTFAAAKMLKARGYSLEQSLALLNR